VDSAWTAAAELAERLARAAASSDPSADGLRIALARAVLNSELVIAAGDALGGGPHALTRALDLAAMVLDLERAADGVGIPGGGSLTRLTSPGDSGRI